VGRESYKKKVAAKNPLRIERGIEGGGPGGRESKLGKKRARANWDYLKGSKKKMKRKNN